jgi:ABC-type dipeptide/oligopeptide/nickel transport system ATPase component
MTDPFPPTTLPQSSAPAAPLLDVRDLRVRFFPDGQPVDAVRGISYSLSPGQTLAVVGESGSGKSAAALALTRLLPASAQISGTALYDGCDILAQPESGLRRLRGREIAYIFQEPGASLNPAFTIGFQIAETLRTHCPREKDVRGRVVGALEEVGIRDAAARYGAYPHELSGGMQQRVMIAMSLIASPRLLIADEPTTALDVTVQKQILVLIAEICRRRRMAVLLITHNFGVVANFADAVLVMRHGEIVERGRVGEVLSSPVHEYTRSLLAAIPRLRNRPV